MNKQIYIILISIISIVHISCINFYKKKPVNNNAIHLYQIAHYKLLHKNYTESIQALLKLQNLYLYEPCPQQIYLDLIYAYYKIHDLQSANKSIHQFVQSYPNHKHLDYILYMHGIINMNLDRNNFSYLQKYFNMNWFNRSPVYANIAFRSLLKLIQNYPNSQYICDAYKRLIFLKNRIANYELAIIKFYNQRHAYISVITHTEKMLHNFPNTKATYQALFYMQKAYLNIHLIDQAAIVNKIIIENQKYIN